MEACPTAAKYLVGITFPPHPLLQTLANIKEGSTSFALAGISTLINPTPSSDVEKCGP